MHVECYRVSPGARGFPSQHHEHASSALRAFGLCAKEAVAAQCDNTMGEFKKKLRAFVAGRQHVPHRCVFDGLDLFPLALLAANSRERLPKVGTSARHVVKRRIEDRFHESPLHCAIRRLARIKEAQSIPEKPESFASGIYTSALAQDGPVRKVRRRAKQRCDATACVAHTAKN